MPSYIGKVPKIVWRKSVDYMTESFESPPYAKEPTDGFGHALPNYILNFWVPGTNASEGPYAGAGDFGITPSGDPGSIGAQGTARSGRWLATGQYRTPPPSVAGGSWDSYLERTFGGYIPGEKVKVSIKGGMAWDGAFSTSGKIGLWVNGVKDAVSTGLVWHTFTVNATADSSGNLVVRFGGFDIVADNLIIWVFDDLNLPAGTFTDPDATVNFPRPPEKAIGWSQPDVASVALRYDSGLEDAWINKFDRMLSMDVNGILPDDGTTEYGDCSGWDKWRAFLESARDGAPFDFFPDRDDPDTMIQCALVGPMTDAPSLGWNQHRNITLQIRRLDGMRWEGY